MHSLKVAGLAALTSSLALMPGAAGADDAAGVWTKKAPMRYVRNEMQAATVNGKIYMIGGGRTETKDGQQVDNATNGDTEEYDPATNTWRVRTTMPEGGSHNSIAVLDGKIYMAGGFAGRQHTLPTASVWSYDPAADAWKKLAPLSGPRAAIALTAVDGKVHAFGGRFMGEEESLATHEVYDPKTDKWTAAAPMPSARDHMGIGVVDGKVHVFGGTGGSETNVALHEIYDPKTDKWSSSAPMPTARSSSAFATYKGLLVFLGGECKITGSTRTSFDENEAYDPKTNSWRKLTALPSGRHGFAADTVGNTLYVLGGSTACGSGGKLNDTLAFTLP
jgi:N-acetylneuraminic acid mutarotase